MSWAQTFNVNNSMANSISGSMSNIKLSNNITQAEIDSKITGIFGYGKNNNQAQKVPNSIFEDNHGTQNPLMSTTQGSIENTGNPLSLPSPTMVAAGNLQSSSPSVSSATFGQSAGV